MNTFNRVLVILWLLGCIGVAAFGFVQPVTALALLGNAVGWLNAFVTSQFYVYLAMCVALLAVCVLLLFFEVRRTERATVKVQHSGGSVVELATESVARGLEYHIRQVPGVLGVRPRVVSTGKAIRLAMDLEIDPSADVPSKTEEIIQLARETIEGKLGVKLAKATVNVRQAEYVAPKAPVTPVEQSTAAEVSGSEPGTAGEADADADVGALPPLEG